MLIATHDGTFHADETVACAVLSYVFDNTSVIRTRNPIELEKADIIIDVSGKNDNRHFDHHSKEFTLSRDNGIRYATAGLMWQKFGKDFLKKIALELIKTHYEDDIIDAAFKRIDHEIMCMVDLNDNGQLNEFLENKIAPKTAEGRNVFNALNEFYQIDPGIPYIVAMQNLPAVSGHEQDKAFMQTVKMLKQILQSASINALNTEFGIKEVLKIYDGGKILIMHTRLPWTQAVLSHFDVFKNCVLAVYPDRKRGWRVQSLPLSKASRFANRCGAPLTWRGLDGQSLDKASGLNGTIFVHKAGFTGGALSFETNLEMAKLWLKLGEYPVEN